MHAFISLGLLASSVAASALTKRGEDLQPCGNAFYVPSQYTCYPGDKLCPVLNGVATKPCGEDCYSESMYSCVDGSLAPPTPSPETTFRLSVVIEGSSSPGSFVEASGLVFRVGGEPGTYCPSNVGTCPPGTETDFICVDGYCSLNVAVPGGQYIYIAINGALSFTQAHSGIAPPGSFFNGFDVNDGKLQFQGDDWLSCPPADGTTDFQLFASALSKGYNGCVSVTLSIEAIVASNFGAWQYI